MAGGGKRSETETVCGSHAASMPTTPLKKGIPQQGGMKKNRMGQRVDYTPPPSSLMTQENNTPHKGGKQSQTGAACGIHTGPCR